MTNAPLSVERLQEQDTHDKERLIRELGFVLKTVEPRLRADGTIQHIRGPRKKADNIPWTARCKKHWDRARKMEDPNDPGHHYASITDRWDRDLQYRENFDECSLEYFNKHGGSYGPRRKTHARSWDCHNPRTDQGSNFPTPANCRYDHWREQLPNSSGHCRVP